MTRAPFLTLLALLSAATACNTDQPTAPGPGAARPSEDVAVGASLATLLGKPTVDDAGDVGAYTSLTSSPDGTQRIAYYDKTNRRLKYASCSSNCTAATNWQSGVIDESADVGPYTTLKVKSGVRHVVYYDATNHDLKYATCSADCFIQGNWKKGTIAQTGNVGSSASLAIGGSGNLYVSYVDGSLGTLKYATCFSGCTSAANWQGTTVDPSTTVYAKSFTSIAVGADGRRHISYAAAKHLRYAACPASCTDPANWQKLTVDAADGSGTFSSLAVDANGVRHISYYYLAGGGGGGDLKYARCASNCDTSAGWARVVADPGTSSDPNVGGYTSMAVGADGKAHVSYYTYNGGRLRYASCAGSCLQSASWQRQYVDGGCTLLSCPGTVGTYTSLRLGDGKVHISYYSVSKGALKYAELTE